MLLNDEILIDQISCIRHVAYLSLCNRAHHNGMQSPFNHRLILKAFRDVHTLEQEFNQGEDRQIVLRADYSRPGRSRKVILHFLDICIFRFFSAVISLFNSSLPVIQREHHFRKTLYYFVSVTSILSNPLLVLQAF